MLLLLAISTYGSAQQVTTALKIGDQLPDLAFTTYSGKKIMIKDLYQNGPLIIDFWATWCVPCLKEIRLMDSFDQRKPNQFKFLLVSSQNKKAITDFMARPTNEDMRSLGDRIIIEDSLLNNLFPHKTIPHNIWIDSKGIIRAITSGEEITEKNIFDFRANPSAFKIRTKSDKLDFRPMEVFHLGDSTFTYRSIICPFIEGIASGEVISQRGEMKSYFQFNQPILRALWGAYSSYNHGIRPEMIEIHTPDSSRFFQPKVRNTIHQKYADRTEWKQKNLFCYSLTLPYVVPDSLFASYIYNDMERQFNLKVSVEKRRINCIVVTADQKLPKRNPERKENKLKINYTKDRILKVNNATITELLDFLFRLFPPERLPYPFINNTAYPADLRFDIEEDFSLEPDILKSGLSSEMIFRRLKKYGLNFKTQVQPYPVLVIHDLKK